MSWWDKFIYWLFMQFLMFHYIWPILCCILIFSIKVPKLMVMDKPGGHLPHRNQHRNAFLGCKWLECIVFAEYFVQLAFLNFFFFFDSSSNTIKLYFCLSLQLFYTHFIYWINLLYFYLFAKSLYHQQPSCLKYEDQLNMLKWIVLVLK